MPKDRLPRRSAPRNDKGGFTLIELLVVISIIAILSAVGFVSYQGVRGKALDAKVKADLNAIKKAYESNYDPTANGGQGGYKALSPTNDGNSPYFADGKIPTQSNGSVYPCAIGPDATSVNGSYGCTTQNSGGYQVNATLPSDSSKTIFVISNQGTLPASQLNSCYAGGTLTNGLVGHWKMDEVSWNGTQAEVKDSQNTNHGTALAGATTVEGKIKKAGDFNASGKVVQLSASIPLNGVSYSIAAWSKFPLSNIDYWKTLTRGATADHQILVGGTILGVFDNATGTGFHSSGFDVNTLTPGWHHIVAVGSGSSTQFYIDGVSKGTSNFKSNAEVTFIGNCYAGCGQWWGQLDEVRVYNRALSSEDVASLFSCTP